MENTNNDALQTAWKRLIEGVEKAAPAKWPEWPVTPSWPQPGSAGPWPGPRGHERVARDPCEGYPNRGRGACLCAIPSLAGWTSGGWA